MVPENFHITSLQSKSFKHFSENYHETYYENICQVTLAKHLSYPNNYCYYKQF